MKNKQAAILTGMVLCMAVVTGCSNNTEAQSEKHQESEIEDTESADEKSDGETGASEEINKENQIFGKIVSISEDSITISAESAPTNGKEDGEENSSTEESGEEKIIALTENTVIRKQTMGQPGGAVPEQPEGEQPENGGISEQSEGEQPENGGIPEQSEGKQPENGEISEQPDAEQPEKPEGEAPNGGMPDQEAGEEISWSDLKEGDMVSILLDEDGNAESVSIMEGDMEQPGGAGLFAYDKGTIYASGTTIKTEQDTSGGVHAAGGGSFYGWDLDVITEGESSAAVRSDRGGGTMVLDGGNYISNGTGSPAVYCTADIAVNNAELTANGSEAVCIEGLNSLHLYDCDLTGNMSDDDRNDCTWNVILYQSMSGDSQVGNSTFEMNGGTLTGKNGGMFYTTNTESTITLSDVEISYPEDSEYFLKCTGNANERGWGESGANGADCLFTAISQKMQGDILWDSISQLDIYLTDQSSLYGAIVNDESNAGNGGGGYCAVYVEADSEWTVTEDSTVTELHCEGTVTDEEGKTVTIKGSDGTTYVDGDSSYTITTEVYEDSADSSGASAVSEWSAYEMEKPEEL